MVYKIFNPRKEITKCLLLILWHIDIQGGIVYGSKWNIFIVSESVLSGENLTNEEASRKYEGRSCSDKPKNNSELHQEEYMPLARRRIN